MIQCWRCACSRARVTHAPWWSPTRSSVAPHSLVHLNEALAGTSSFEAVDLASGVVRGLRFLGVRAIYVTHLHELAAAVADINATTPGDAPVGSLVAEPGATQAELQVRTF